MEKLTDELREEMLKHSSYKKENIVEQYNELSSNYENVYLTAGWTDPLKNAELCNEVLKDEASTAQVLDLGCGTGLVG